MTSSAHHLARLAEQSFERHGDRETLFFEGRWHRSGELFDRTRRLAGGLAGLGIRPGDRVVVTMANTPEVGVLYTALWRAGAVVTPAIFLLSATELHHILIDSEATAVVTTREFLPTVRAAAEGVTTLRALVCTDAEPGTTAFTDLETAPPLEIADRNDDDLAALLYTGGTTGRAKGVMLSHESLWSAGESSYRAGHVPGITRSLVSLPLSHAFGLLVTVVGLHGVEPGESILMRWFDPDRFLRLVEEHRVQVVPVVPSMLQALLAQPLEDHDLSSLRYLASGAAPLSGAVAREIERRIPGVEILEGYGLTESAGIVSTNPPGRRRLGSVGTPVPGCEVRIVDDEDRELARGERGQISVRSGTVMDGYWRSPELTAAALHGGWLRTGDVGHVDADGYLFVSDRIKDLIIRGGFNVYPRDVEDVLVAHPAVAQAAVVGRPDSARGEEVVAFVSLRAGESATAEEIIEFARGRLATYKYPRVVHIVDAIPLTPVGKLDRKQLRRLILEQTLGCGEPAPHASPRAAQGVTG